MVSRERDVCILHTDALEVFVRDRRCKITCGNIFARIVDLDIPSRRIKTRENDHVRIVDVNRYIVAKLC